MGIFLQVEAAACVLRVDPQERIEEAGACRAVGLRFIEVQVLDENAQIGGGDVVIRKKLRTIPTCTVKVQVFVVIIGGREIINVGHPNSPKRPLQIDWTGSRTSLARMTGGLEPGGGRLLP